MSAAGGFHKYRTLAGKWKYIKYQHRRLWIEYPELAAMGLLAVGGASVALNKAFYQSRHPNLIVKPYKEQYTIYRSDDPRAYRIRCSPDLPPDDPHILRI